MFEWLKRFRFSKKKNFTSEEMTAFGEAEFKAMEKVLGPSDEVVGHALIPFQIGGPVDMYYFSQYLPGTVFATMELLEPDGSGPKPNRMGTYELITCTRIKTDHKLNESHEDRLERIKANKTTSFEIIENHLRYIMTGIGRYSFTAILQPGQTADLPAEEGEMIHLIFDEFDTRGVPFEINGRRHGLLLLMEIFASELDYSRRYGSGLLFDKLKEAGVYPYSDMDRKPVV